MGKDESIKDDYGFTRNSTPTTNLSQEESPTYSNYGRSPPDQRRFAIALSELPALNFYNPLLNNPSSSEYIASVRSSIRSIDEIASAHLSMHPRLASDGTIGSTNLTSASMLSPYWSQHSVKSVKSVDSSRASETNPKSSVTFSSNFVSCRQAAKSILGFCICMWSVLFLGVTIATVIYFTGKGGTLFQPPQAPAANIIYGEFHVFNHSIMFETFDGSSVNTTLFKDLTNELHQKMDRSFQSSPLLSALYNRSAIFGVVPNISLKDPLIRIQFQIHLNHADVMVAEKMAHAFTSDLHRKEGHYGHTSENWSINLTTVKFAASWGQWTQWTPECYSETSCDPMRMQSRNRRCLLRDKRSDEPIESTANLPNNVITPCIAGSTVSAADIEIRPCSCAATRFRTPRPRISFSVVRPTKAGQTHFRFSNTSIATFDQLCSQCRSGEVCVARLEEIVPVCRWAPNPEDPSGCGGFCRAYTESCLPLGSNSFKCEGVSECLTDIEWRCGDGFCIHNSKRCDRDYNCFDHSDELDCGNDEFH
ncbi:hypothetical protein DAPPUDRAFT_234097 [Daphnia pulex]|uniref:SEA domain-containing protein n=1 Tax=Daphnia pulex TaxID=6669 RepID=E9FUK1_DAPPU|nr:hypothetical protein DAPPUDRAFT_234097 [Daphnia pulex]|eukprot:EFX88742.1 hypothetical protein DAPPUDRAFT_234097 [Daphnia pulex]